MIRILTLSYLSFSLVLSTTGWEYLECQVSPFVNALWFRCLHKCESGWKREERRKFSSLCLFLLRLILLYFDGNVDDVTVYRSSNYRIRQPSDILLSVRACNDYPFVSSRRGYLLLNRYTSFQYIYKLGKWIVRVRILLLGFYPTTFMLYVRFDKSCHEEHHRFLAFLFGLQVVIPLINFFRLGVLPLSS